MRLHAIGYWFDERAPNAYPRPQRLVGRWRAADRARVLDHLARGDRFETYGAYSFCRFGCGIASRAMGRAERTDGVYVWPDGLAHYVEHHGVRLPPAFVAHAGAPSRAVPARHEGLVSDARWLAWAAREGAVLDARGWRGPDAAARAKIRAALGTRGDPVWIHDRPRRAVVRFADGSLLVATFGARIEIETLASWDEWAIRSARRPTG